MCLKDFMRANMFSNHDSSLWLLNAPRYRLQAHERAGYGAGRISSIGTRIFRVNKNDMIDK